MPTESQLNNEDLYKSANPWVFKTIDVSDINLYPYNAYKTWTVQSGSSTSSCLPLNAIYNDVTHLPALGTELIYNDSKNIDGSLQTVTYFSINRLFYKHKNNIFFSLGPSENLSNINICLYESASILSFPYKKIGDGIKKQSFELSTTINGIDINLKSNKYGEIYNTQIDSASIISNIDFYEGFNEYFDINRIKEKSITSPVYIEGNVSFTDGIPATDGLNNPIGKCANFNGSGSFIINKSSITGNYNRATNYAISFFISASSIGSNTQNIITKKPDSSDITRSPYSITLDANKKIQFAIISAMFNGASYNTWSNPYKEFINLSKCNYVSVTSSAAVASDWNHVVCQKSGSYLQIYINGTLQSSTYYVELDNTNSNYGRVDCVGNTYVGGWIDSLNNNSNNFIGKLDEIRFYNKALSLAEVGYLANRSETGTMLQTNVVGNIFELNGIAVITSPNYIYNNILQSPYIASYKSTVTRHELSVLVRVGAGDLNMSLNSSLLQDDGVSYQKYISGSADFHTYITTIGLYDNHANLVAIGKLATPIKKRNDIDINFIIQLDLENTIKINAESTSKYKRYRDNAIIIDTKQIPTGSISIIKEPETIQFITPTIINNSEIPNIKQSNTRDDVM